MAIPLIVLAIGSVVAGYVGVPRVLGGENRIERFLEPSFEAHERVTAVGEPLAAEPAETAEAGEAAHGEASTELTLMAVSIGAAFGGIALAWFFFLKRRDVTENVARSYSGVHRLLLNKYYVDELYDATIVQPIKQTSTVALWKGVDAGGIDGLVNGAGAVVRGGGSILRRLQSGSVRVYAASLFLGVVLVLGYYLWP